MQTKSLRPNFTIAVLGVMGGLSAGANDAAPVGRTYFDGPNHFIRVPGGRSRAFTSTEAALDDWREELRTAAGLSTIDLREEWNSPLSDGRRTVHAFRQFVDGLPVEPGGLRVVLSETSEPAVEFAIGLVARQIPPLAGGLNRIQAIQAAAGQPGYQHFSDWSNAAEVIYVGEDGNGVPLRAWRVTGDNHVAGAAHDRRTLFLMSAGGAVAAVRDEILHATVSGSIFGYATVGTLPDMSSNPPVYQTIPDIFATSGLTSGVTGPSGEFALATGGSNPVSVTSTTGAGTIVMVHNSAGPDLLASAVLTPGINGTLTMNYPPNEFNTSQLNAFLNATLAHDFFRSRSNFTPIDAPITALVNETGMCNASFDGSLNFFRAQPGCNDSAYSTLVAHEYGHYIVSKLGLGQGAFGEGFADSLAMLLFQTPTIGDQYYTDGTAMRHPGTDGRQYPCSGEIHYCGELLAGVWWDIRQNLIASYGTVVGQNLAAQLFVDWAQITGGGNGSNYTNSAYPQTAIEVLTVDDDDGDLGNGTPNYGAICAAFSAHGIACPTVPPILYSYPSGLPAWIAPNRTTVVPVNVQPGIRAPSPGTATMSYSIYGGGYSTVALTDLGNNSYLATLPALACGTPLRYYFSARATDGTLVNDPAGGSAAPYATSVAQSSSVIFSDNFETDRGWVGAAPGDTATSGRWERAAPQATLAQPGSDHTGNGGFCWVTGALAGSSASSYDVDNGITTLLSPVWDFSGTVDVTIGYWRWYSNSTSSPAPNEDVFDISVTNDLTHWVLVERIGPTGNETQGGWYYHQIRLSTFVPPTSTVQLRFVASDLNNSSTVEALVDDVQVTAFLCTGGGCAQPGCSSDTNGDCLVNLSDLVTVLAHFGTVAAGLPGDVNGDGRVDLNDLGAVLASYGSDCR